MGRGRRCVRELEREVVHVAPAPIFAGSYERMSGCREPSRVISECDVVLNAELGERGREATGLAT